MTEIWERCIKNWMLTGWREELIIRNKMGSERLRVPRAQAHLHHIPGEWLKTQSQVCIPQARVRQRRCPGHSILSGFSFVGVLHFLIVPDKIRYILISFSRELVSLFWSALMLFLLCKAGEGMSFLSWRSLEARDLPAAGSECMGQPQSPREVQSLYGNLAINKGKESAFFFCNLEFKLFLTIPRRESPQRINEKCQLVAGQLLPTLLDHLAILLICLFFFSSINIFSAQWCIIYLHIYSCHLITLC